MNPALGDRTTAISGVFIALAPGTVNAQN